MDEVVEIKDLDVRVIGANAGLVPGERIRASYLMKSMLVASHNDSTLALARHFGGSHARFVALMNDKAESLGMNDTKFANPIGFDDALHYSSAHDLVKLVERFNSQQGLSEAVKVKEVEIWSEDKLLSHKVRTTNKLLLEDESVVGIKTGYTTEAKGNLMTRTIRDGADVVTIILGSDDREGDSRKIINWVYSVYRW
jgi:serine-type D-Ala-D-Ala carboxypeptidase (penicillin-binding protein 5/6)